VRRRALVLAAFAGALWPASAAAAAPRLEHPHPCPGIAGFTCSTLAVPLDRRAPGRGTLRLQVAAADNARAPRGVLLQLTGGPGQPGLPLVRRLSSALAPALRAYRLVMLDQRGTGGGALSCPQLQQAMGSSDLLAPPASAVRACGASLGARRSLFGTDDVVADLESLRQALGVERWTIDGVSYGTYVAERYALAHPRRVSRLVLDSVVPHDASAALVETALPEVARVLRLACRGTGCPGDPADDLAVVVRSTHAGPDLLAALTLESIVDPTFRSVFDVPVLLHDARLGRLNGLQRFVATTRSWSAIPAAELSQGLHASALCGDWSFPWGDSATPSAVRAPRLARAVARLPARTLWPFDRATASFNGIVRQCLPWPSTPPTPAPPRGARLPPVPTLLLAGDRDLSTPVPWARAEAALAPQGKLVVVPGAGHSIQTRARSPVGRDALFRFLLG
jgi:pimeloyl-ACP methyl ester carboxylesterase